MAAKKDAAASAPASSEGKVSVDESIAQTQEEAQPASAEPKKGELTGAVILDGTEHPAGTKVSGLDLSKAQRDRLERLDLIA